MIRLLVLFLFIISFNAVAEESNLWITSTVHSFHTNRTAGYNEDNFGIGYEATINKDMSYGVGTYKNSIDKDSTYFGIMYTPFSVFGLKLGTMNGVIDGYSSDKTKFGLLLVPVVRYEGKRWGVNAIIVPPIKSVDSGVIGFQIKYKVF